MTTTEPPDTNVIAFPNNHAYHREVLKDLDDLDGDRLIRNAIRRLERRNVEEMDATTVLVEIRRRASIADEDADALHRMAADTLKDKWGSLTGVPT